MPLKKKEKKECKNVIYNFHREPKMDGGGREIPSRGKYTTTSKNKNKKQKNRVTKVITSTTLAGRNYIEILIYQKEEHTLIFVYYEGIQSVFGEKTRTKRM